MPDAIYYAATKVGVTCMDFDPEYKMLVVGDYTGNIVFINLVSYSVVKVNTMKFAKLGKSFSRG